VREDSARDSENLKEKACRKTLQENLQKKPQGSADLPAAGRLRPALQVLGAQ